MFNRCSPQKQELANTNAWSLFDTFPVSGYFRNGLDAWSPDIDISEDKDNYYVKADLPGLKKEDVSVAIEDDVLTIRGERKQETEQKEKNYHRVERSYGVFQRSFNVGQVKTEQIKAKYENGVLDVTLPKQEQAKPQNINIDVT